MRKRCDLTIRDVSPSDAGFFVCFQPSDSKRQSAALVVLGIKCRHCFRSDALWTELITQKLFEWRLRLSVNKAVPNRNR